MPFKSPNKHVVSLTFRSKIYFSQIVLSTSNLIKWVFLADLFRRLWNDPQDILQGKLIFLMLGVNYNAITDKTEYLYFNTT